MSAIEIYTKVMEVIGSSDYEDASIALEFAQRKINNLKYSNQALQGQVGSQLGCYPTPENYAAKQAAAIREEVKGIVREVLDEGKSEKEAA